LAYERRGGLQRGRGLGRVCGNPEPASEKIGEKTGSQALKQKKKKKLARAKGGEL